MNTDLVYFVRHLFILYSSSCWIVFVACHTNTLPKSEQGGLFADNLKFIGLLDYFKQLPVKHHAELFVYDEQALIKELDFWQNHDQITLRFTSPARLKTKEKGKGTPSLVRDRCVLAVGDTERYIYHALCSVSPAIKAICQIDAISYRHVADKLFWTDNSQTIKNNKVAPFGGVMGEITLSQPISEDKTHLSLLILGQYFGIGENRRCGMGRYHLRSPEGKGTAPTRQFTKSHLSRSAGINTLELACYNIARKHPYIRKYIDHTLEESESDIDDQLEDKTLLGSINLHALSQQLEKEHYQASILQGIIARKATKHPRLLAVPPLEDRIAQRAVVEIMGVDIDKLSSIHSYGYRRGLSRLNARDQILMLNRQGYDWFFEADIEEFFDLISYSEIENRLQSFFPDEPLIPLIMEWIKAPVQFDGKVIQRTAGLPQGSPISPMIANLMLEDFDTDLEAADMKLVRFADDFVILCKNKQQAQLAAERAEKSLAEMGLVFNPKKTHIGEFNEGFQFLGYSFLNGMAIENIHSHKTAEKLRIDNIPTASWLATLLKKQPQMLDKLNNTLDKKHRLSDPSHITGSPPKNNRKNTLPASELGSTLFITQPTKSLHQKDGVLVIIDVQSKDIISQQNWNDLNSIVLIGRHNVSQYCLVSALNNSIPIHYCSASGKYQGVTLNNKPSQEGTELWLQQIKTYREDKKHTLQISKALVEARIHNQLEVIRQRIRHTTTDEKSPVTAMQKLINSLQSVDNQDQLRGYEGQASALYFAQIAKWIPEEFEFKIRKKRPSPDPFNALLSLGYTILYSHTSSILLVAGLYPWLGFYHQGYGRHLALASDLMEVFRHIIERTAMTMLRSGQLKPDDFYILHDDSCRLTRGALKIYLTQLNSRMLKPLADKNSSTAMNMHEQLLRQANQLIRNIRNSNELVEFFKLK